jgi:hypothetical protein
MMKGAHMGAGSVESSSRPSLARAVTTTTNKMRTGSRLGPELVGRRDELAALEDELARAVAGEFRLVLMQGEAGTGKSRRVVTSPKAGEAADHPQGVMRRVPGPDRLAAAAGSHRFDPDKAEVPIWQTTDRNSAPSMSS